MFYIDAYLTHEEFLPGNPVAIFKEDARKFDEREKFELLRALMTYIEDMGDDEVIIIKREFS